MDKLAHSILKSPFHVVIVSLISSMIPIVALVILGLVTLRKGVVAALPVVVILGAALMSVYHYLGSSWWMALGLAALLVLPLWGLALFLRITVSFYYTVIAAAAMVMTLSVMMTIGYGGSIQVFTDLLVCQTGINSPGGDQAQALKGLQVLAQMTPLWPMLMFLNYVVVIGVARWWQACAFNPGGFQEEFHNLHFSRVITSLSAILIIAGLITHIAILDALSWLAMALLSVHGLSVIHWYVKAKNINAWWLVPFYILLFLADRIFLPILVVISLMDSYYPLRK